MTIKPTSTELSINEQNLLRMIFDWWLIRCEWPKAGSLGRSKEELVPPDLIDPIIRDLIERNYITEIGGSRRLALRLPVMACFKEAKRTLRHAAAFLDMAKEDLAANRDEEPFRNYTILEVASRLHIGLIDCRRLLQTLGAETSISGYRDPWQSEDKEKLSHEQILNYNAFTTPRDWRNLAAAESAEDYLIKFHGKNSLPYQLSSINNHQPSEVVIHLERDKHDFWLDGYRITIPDGLHFETLCELIDEGCYYFKYDNYDTPAQKTEIKNRIKTRMNSLRDSIQGAANVAGLIDFKVKEHIVSIRGQGYRLEIKTDNWYLKKSDLK
ncbi:MAG: hypothetical protein JW841_17005 [Deltaproteobacteria bacterium]|nr:hypothetical protein [Deltaproteobacteria bacterium]